MTSPPISMPARSRRLRPDQVATIDAMLRRPFVNLRLGTGTGKLVVMVHAAYRMALAGKRTLLLVPNSNRRQIIPELTDWLGADAATHIATLGDLGRRERLDIIRAAPPILLATHECLSDKELADAIGASSWDLAVLDEGSRFRRYSLRTKALIYKVKAKRRVLMSGTLTTKSPGDLWYPFRWLKPGIFGTTRRETFLQEYCILGGYTGKDPIDVRPDRLAQLEAIINAVSITLNLSDVRDDMPERTFTRRDVPLTPAQRRRYAELRDTLVVELQGMNDEEFRLEVDTYVGRMMRLQEIAAGFLRNADGEVLPLTSTKTNELVELLFNDPVPTIVWTWWVPERELIKRRLDDEGIPWTDDYEKFNNGEADVLILQIAAGGYGLNIDRADRMIYHSLPWDLDAYLQSQERNWRYTTTRPREVVHLVAEDTVDEHVREKLMGKASMARKLNRSDALNLLLGKH